MITAAVIRFCLCFFILNVKKHSHSAFLKFVGCYLCCYNMSAIICLCVVIYAIVVVIMLM